MYFVSIYDVNVERQNREMELTFAVVMTNDELFQDLGKSIRPNKNFFVFKSE